MKRLLVRPTLRITRKHSTRSALTFYVCPQRLGSFRSFSAPPSDFEKHFQQFSTKSDGKISAIPSIPSFKELAQMYSKQSWKQFFIHAGAFLVVVSGVVYAIFSFWGEHFRSEAVKQTTVVAHQTLSSDEVSKKVVVLSNQVAQNLLENPQVLAHVTEFAKKLILMEQTKQSATELIVHAIKTENTREVATQLTKLVAANLMADELVKAQLADLLRRAVVVEENKEALFGLLKSLVDDPKTHTLLTDLAKQVVFQTLHDQEVKTQSIQFLREVLKDPSLHNRGGEALWEAIKVALIPSFLQSKPRTPEAPPKLNAPEELPQITKASFPNDDQSKFIQEKPQGHYLEDLSQLESETSKIEQSLEVTESDKSQPKTGDDTQPKIQQDQTKSQDQSISGDQPKSLKDQEQIQESLKTSTSESTPFVGREPHFQGLIVSEYNDLDESQARVAIVPSEKQRLPRET